MVLPWFAAPTKLNEKIRSAGISRDRINKTIDHASRRAIESPFTSQWTPGDCFLDTIQTLGHKRGDDVAKVQKVLLGSEITQGKGRNVEQKFEEILEERGGSDGDRGRDE